MLALVQEQLIERGISAAAASTRAVGNHYLIRNMERGGRWPTVEHLIALCHVLGLEFRIGPPRNRSGEWALEGVAALDRFTKSRDLPVRRWVRGDVSRTRELGRAPAPEGLSDPKAFYVVAGEVDMGNDGIWAGHYCLVCPGVPLAVGRRVWLRGRVGGEALRRLVAMDADEYCLRACRIPEGPGRPAPFFAQRWKRADVTAIGVVLAVYRDEPKVGESQEPDVESSGRGLYLWLQEGTLGDFEQLRRALSGWQRAWGSVGSDEE